MTILNVEKIDGGWKFTLDTPPACGWDVYLHGNRIATRLDSETYRFITHEVRPPEIDVIDPYEGDTASLLAKNNVVLQWNHFAPEANSVYLVERSMDGETFLRIGVVPAGGNVVHTFRCPAVDGETWWRVFLGKEDELGAYRKSLPIEISSVQAGIPKSPMVDVSVVGKEGSDFLIRVSPDSFGNV